VCIYALSYLHTLVDTLPPDVSYQQKRINPSLESLKGIISDHFELSCTFAGEIGRGSSARCFRYTLSTGLNLAAKIILPREESLKTEVKVATMTFLRGNASQLLLESPY
jgi:hypothetical protein